MSTRGGGTMNPEPGYRVVALPSARSLRFNPGAKPQYSWHRTQAEAERSAKICRQSGCYGRIRIEEEANNADDRH